MVVDGITYDDAVYRVWVEITDDLKGQLHATVHIYDDEGIPQDKISFVNIYQVTGDASVTLSGDKMIDGRDWKEDDRFTVELYEADENFNPTETPKMSAEMNATTRSYTLSLDYTEADVGKTFYYVLTEKDSGATINGLTYSSAVYQIKVVVEDDGKGGVVTTVVIVTQLHPACTLSTSTTPIPQAL
jgi:pilin isopeptide linkage protein